MPIEELPVVFGSKPYASIRELPAYIRKKPINKQRQWREVFNSSFARHGSESRAFAEANSVIGRKAATHTGVMLALYPQPNVAKNLAIPGGEPADELHVTLLFFGDVANITEQDLQRIQLAAEKAVAVYAPLSAQLGGLGRFYTTDEDGNQAFYASVDAPILPQLRQDLANSLPGLYKDNHGFSPHMTLKYVKPEESTPDKWTPVNVKFNDLHMVVAGIDKAIPFTGEQ